MISIAPTMPLLSRAPQKKKPEHHKSRFEALRSQAAPVFHANKQKAVNHNSHRRSINMSQKAGVRKQASLKKWEMV